MCKLRNSLEESHKDLHQWFLLHQECLLLQNDDYARDAIGVFSTYLYRHIEFENTFVLPAIGFSDLLHWSVTVYEKEHEKLIRMLDGIQQMLARYYLFSGREKRLALLELLEKEQSFLRVMEHHEQREGQDLFDHLPQLDASVHEQWLQVQETLFLSSDELKQSIKKYLEHI
jgi:hypothetical protein